MSSDDPQAETLAQAIDRILTFDQKTLIFKTRAESYVKAAYAAVEFTPAHQKKVDAIVKEIAKDLQGHQMYSALCERMNEVLTDKQRETILPGGVRAQPGNVKRVELTPGG